MVDGFRVLENGDYRVIEADFFRITENFDTADSGLSASGSLNALAISTAFAFTDAIGGEGIFSATPTLTVTGSSNFTGTGSITATGNNTTFGEFSLSASSTLVNDPQIGKFANADLQGSSSLTSDATVTIYAVDYVASSALTASADRKLFGFADLTMFGTHISAGDRLIGFTHNFDAINSNVVAEGLVTRPALTSINATGSVSSLATYKANGVIALTGTGSTSTIGGNKLIGATNLSNSGINIFDPVAQLILKPTSNLTATGTIGLVDTYTQFVTEIYVNTNGTWKLVEDPYVKHSNTWKVPTYIYKKVSGNWQRVH